MPKACPSENRVRRHELPVLYGEMSVAWLALGSFIVASEPRLLRCAGNDNLVEIAFIVP